MITYARGGNSATSSTGGYTPAKPKGDTSLYTPGVITQGTKTTISSGGKLSAITGQAEPNISLSGGGVGVGVGGKIVSRTTSQPIALKSSQASQQASAASVAVAFQPGIVERSVQVPGSTVTGQNSSTTFAPRTRTETFFQSSKGDLFALPSSVKGEKAKALEARLIAAESKGPVTSSTVGRNLQAIGLGSSGVVAQYADVKYRISESTPYGVVNPSPKEIFEYQKTLPQTVTVQYGVSPASIVASQGQPVAKPSVASREQLTRVVYKAGETSLEPAFAKTAQQVRDANKDFPIIGDVGAAFVGIVGGGAKLAETAVRAPFIASKALYETATQGRPSRETVVSAAGNVASFTQVSPASLVIDTEKTVASESGQPVIRSPEELKQAGIALVVGAGVGLASQRAFTKLGTGSVKATETGTVLVRDVRTGPSAVLKTGTFETTGVARTAFGQKVTVPSGGTFSTFTEGGKTQSVVYGIARPKGEIVPFVSKGLAREVQPGVNLGIETTFIQGKKPVGATSVSGSKILAVTQEQAFQGQLGGKLPVGGTLSTTKSAIIGKSEGVLSSGGKFEVSSKNIITEPATRLPAKLGGPQYFKPEGKVSVPTQAKQVQVAKVQQVQAPTFETGAGRFASEYASQLQKTTGQTLGKASQAVFTPKGYAGAQQEFTVQRVAPQSQTTAQPIFKPFSVTFEPAQTQTQKVTTGFAQQVSFAPAISTRQQTQQATQSLTRTGTETRLITEPQTRQQTFQFVGAVTAQRQPTQQFFKSLTTTTPTVPTYRTTFGAGGVFGGPKGGFDFGGKAFRGFGGKGVKVKGRLPDLFNISITEKTTGRQSYSLPSTSRITKSRAYKRSGGFLAPTGEQLRGLGKTPYKLGRFFK